MRSLDEHTAEKEADGAAPIAIAAPTPMATVRCGPSAKVVVRIESAAGETKAAPRPCRPRPTMRNSEVVRKPVQRARRP